jgi:hypothetical protein
VEGREGGRDDWGEIAALRQQRQRHRTLNSDATTTIGAPVMVVAMSGEENSTDSLAAPM